MGGWITEGSFDALGKKQQNETTNSTSDCLLRSVLVPHAKGKSSLPGIVQGATSKSGKRKTRIPKVTKKETHKGRRLGNGHETFADQKVAGEKEVKIPRN